MIVLRSASETDGFGGIGTGPQTPCPPFLTFSISFAAAPASPLYFAATSTYAGPTTFLSFEWHAAQPFFLIRSSADWASAAPDTSNPAAASAIAAIFIATPLERERRKAAAMVPERAPVRH